MYEDELLEPSQEERARQEAAVRAIATPLARAALAGEGSAAALRFRFARVLGRDTRWLAKLAFVLRRDFGASLTPDLHDELVTAIANFAPLRVAVLDGPERLTVRAWYPYSPPMGAPPRALGDVQLPALATPGDVAHWLALSPAELDWFCERLRMDPAAPEALRHYRYRWVPKRSGGHRLLEIPKSRLATLQRRIARHILAHVPPHPAACGSVRRRSALDAAAPHAGERVILRIDLQDFFAGIGGGRVLALFRTLGYPPASAAALTALVTHASAAHVLRATAQRDGLAAFEPAFRQQAARLALRHLPQGAPSSPVLANLCAYRLDLRLAAAAQSCGLRYTRYVDDLMFSGTREFAAGWPRFARMACGIIVEEGFSPNFHKTRVLFPSHAQHLLGMVVNRRPNLARAEFDLLKATLHNCVRHGPASQNRHGHADFRAHLMGRLARLAHLHPARGARLREVFARIDWSAGGSAAGG